MNKPLILLGLPGVGKSYWGKKIADHLSVPFYDLDLLIEKETSLSIPEIFDEGGESLFRSIETSVIYDLSTNPSEEAFILALGGGTPAFNNNMGLVANLGKSIYLNLGIEKILQHLSSDTENNRPLIKNTKPEMVKTLLEKLLAEREEYYNMADYMLYERELILDNFIKIINDN